VSSFSKVRFHLLGPWIAASCLVVAADTMLPSSAAVCVLQAVLQLAAFRWLAARRTFTLSLFLMGATLAPTVLKPLVVPRSFVQADWSVDQMIEPVRLWVVGAIGVAMLFHADQQRVRQRRLLLRQQLQRKVRRRSAQIHRINEALRREVARRQATQLRLTRTETHLQSLAQRMQLQVLRKDTDGVITYANEAFCRGIGKNVDDVIGSTDTDLYPPETAQKYRNDDARVMASGIPVDHVESHPTSEGKTGWVQVFKAPDFDEFDRCIGIQMVFWDVTDTYRRTAELQRSEARKRALFDAAREAVLLVDDQGRIVEANPSAEALLGGGPASLAGCLLESVATPDASSSTNPDDERHLEPGQAWVQRAAMRWRDLPTSERREISVRRHDGTVFPAEISVHPIPLENSQGLAVFVRDVTLRHRAIRALRDAKLAAEEASRTKSEFMAGVSHEIRTPLGGITGSAELLSRMDLPPRAKQYVEMIRQSGELLSGVIGDILDFASIEAGRLHVDPVRIDLHQCVGDAFRCLATRAIGKDIELILWIAPEVPRYVVADPKRLRQIVINLAGNAIKFTPRGHVLLRLSVQGPTRSSFKTSPPQDRSGQPQPMIIIEMIDSGIGIPKDLQSRIFQPFEQGESGTTRRYGGTGLGLSISTQLVQQMGGRIEVDSRPGHGSTFRCLLPLPIALYEDTAPEDNMAKDSNVSPKNERASLPKAEGRPVAIEIEHPIQRTAITDLLLANGYRIDRSASLRVVDQIAVIKGGLKRVPKGSQPTEPMRTIYLARVDDISTPSDDYQQVLLKPILPDDLLEALTKVGPPKHEKAPVPPVFIDSAKGDFVGPRRAGRLLVVDDSEVNRTVIHDFLADAGYQADVVNGGPSAIVATANTRYDCILMDLQMPELDGVETMQQIVRRCAFQGIAPPPFVALTAHATDEHQTRCLEAGMKSFLVKPIDPRRLIVAVDQILGNDTSKVRIEREISDGSTTPVIDPAMLSEGESWQATMLASVRGDRDAMHSLAEAFVIEVPQLCDMLQSALQSGNVKDLRRAAHTLKSCLKYVAPQADWQLALDIELAAEAADMEGAKKNSVALLQIAKGWSDRVSKLLTEEALP
jgi:two-component system sensor histidine kinase/response regulator